MMRHGRDFLPSPYQGLLVLAGLISLLGAGQLLGTIQMARQQYRLTENEPLQNAPPELVLASTALGGFRGLIIDYLWIRAMELRIQGAHYEIVQIYDWIGKLEPRIPEVWSYTAHEMVYNIPVALPTPAERWRWIHKGIEHVRDFGLAYNQNSPKLYWQLGYIFWDKLGVRSVDEFRFFYQKKWAQMMEEMLGDPQNLAELVEAALLPATFLQTPEAKNVAAKAAESGLTLERAVFERQELTPAEQEQLQLWQKDPNLGPAFTKVSAWLRAQRLIKTFKMNPAKMLALEKKYGPLDFRLTSSHALYWATEGLQVVAKFPEFKETTAATYLDRLQYSSMDQNFEYGVVVSNTPRALLCIPNFAILDATHQAYEAVLKKWGEYGIPGHEMFLRKVVWSCYMYNRKKEAHKYYQILAKHYPHPDYQQDLDSYAIQQVAGRIKYIGHRFEVETYIIAVMHTSLHALRSGLEQYQGLSQFATICYREYVKRHGNLENINPLEHPLSWKEFQKIAIQLFQADLEKELGSEKGKAFFEKLVLQFPFLAIETEKK